MTALWNTHHTVSTYVALDEGTGTNGVFSGVALGLSLVL